jgi:replicative DNA helicase Mcm
MKNEIDPQERFQEFLSSFRSEDGEYKYRKRLAQMAISNSKSLIVDFDDLIMFDHKLARKITSDPDEVMEYLNKSALTQLKIEDPEYADYVKKITVRFRRLQEKVSLRKIESEHIGKLVMVEGIIVRASVVKPLLLNAAFKCKKCGETSYIEQTGILMKEPSFCPHCQGKSFEFLSKESTFLNSQEIRIQEKPEDLPPGQLPRSMDVKLLEDLVDTARPGDRVSITGIIRARQESIIKLGKSRTFELYIDANFIDVVGKEAEIVEITPEEEEEIKKLAKDPLIHQKLLKSLAPSIYGYDDIKEAILYLLFGGVPKQLPDGISIRGDTNVLLVGDPGTAKSQLLQYVARIAPRGLYTSGRGSTAAGLTAAVVKEKAGGMVLEAGALILADKGVCAIDELDKMRPEDRVSIHEAMEQQSFHPNFELMLANGKKVSIGKFVNSLMKKYKEKVIFGIDCQILDIKDLNIKLLSSFDFYEFKPITASRVSRHKAPKEFIRVECSNGREFIVTPEHPIFVFKDNGISTVEARELKKGDLIPSIKKLKLVKDNSINAEIGSILGFIVTGGHFQKQLSYNLEFANKTALYVEEINDLMSKNRLSFNEINDYNSSVKNFLALIEIAKRKRVPQNLFVANEEAIAGFLRNAFNCDKEIKSELAYFRANSRGLAEDYQDLLLVLGISSRIVSDKTNNAYKVLIDKASFKKFIKKVLNDKNLKAKVDKGCNKKIRFKLLSSSNLKNSYNESLGNSCLNELKDLKRAISPNIGLIEVVKVEKVPNRGKLKTRWVYDVTVEPTHNFISHGLVFHNTVSVAKGGIVATLNARASVLAAANPALGRYDPYRNITENLNLPVTILSRFDLIFVMRDVPESEKDKKMSDHILNLHRLKGLTQEVPIPPEIFRKYISYAKRINPVLTEEAAQELGNFYLKTRSISSSSGSPVAITPRQLEALVRLSEARARAFLRDKVLAEDAKAAIRLMTVSLQNVGIDVTTGKMDIDVIMTGKPKSLRDKMQAVLAFITELERQSGIVEEKKLYGILNEKMDMNEDEAKNIVNQLIKEGILYSPKPNQLKRVIS